MPEGTDISEHQAAFPAGAWDFVIVRLGTGERGAPDRRWTAHRAEAARRHIPCGSYWFADPGRSSPEAQADAYVSQLRESSWELMAWLDIEIGAISRGWEDRFNRRVEAAGFRCGTYATDSVFTTALRGSPWPRWTARWSSNPPQSGPWLIWQYRGDPLDLDRAPSLDPIRASASPPAPPAPAPFPPSPEATGMVTIPYHGQTHTFWVDEAGTVQWLAVTGHKQGRPTFERRAVPGTVAECDGNELRIAAYVGPFGAQITTVTDDGRPLVIEPGPFGFVGSVL